MEELIMRISELHVMRYLSVTSVVLLLVIFITGCGEQKAPTLALNDSSIENPTVSFSKKNVIHHVSLGGADYCEALGLPTGCDANFSLVANMMSDNSISGQWQDTFPGGHEGIHVAVDCMNLIGNFAVIGGVITHGTYGGVDVSGQRAITAVVDNGTSANDPPDQISFSIFPPSQFGLPDDCHDPIYTPEFFEVNNALFDLGHGQVKVW
jgi:hypothetical protein